MANNFRLTLDTISPIGSITANRYYNDINSTVAITSDGTASFMKVWFDGEQNPAKASNPGYAAANWETITGTETTHATGFTANDEGNFYFHLVLMDDVGNESEIYTSDITTFDKTLPVVSNVSLNGGAAYTKERTLTLTFDAVDPDAKAGTPGSGVVSGIITSSDIEGSPIDLNPTAEEIAAGTFTRTITIKSDTPEKTITVEVKVTDAAGNESIAVSDTIDYDPTAATAELTLREKGNVNNLQPYTNVLDFAADIDITSSPIDVVGYKLWGDVQDHTTEPANWTDVSQGTDPIVVDNLKFTAGDGTKTVNVKLIDKAGNITEVTAKTAQVDMTAPTASIAGSSTVAGYISKVSGYDTFTVTPTYDINPGKTSVFAPLQKWELRVDGTAIRTGTTEEGLANPFVLTANDFGGVDGENKSHTVTLYIEDASGHHVDDVIVTNSVETAALTVFVDTLAPTSSGFQGVQTYYTALSDLNFTVSASDSGSGMNTKLAWISAVADDTTPKGSAIAYSDNLVYTELGGSPIEGTNYVHVIYTDKVGNAVTIHSTGFTFDSVAPTDGSIEFTKDAYYSTNAAVRISSSDATSGVAQMKLWGDIAATATSAAGITEAEAEWETYTTEKSVYLTTGDGDKTIYVRFKDTAGNESANAASDTTELDTTHPSAMLECWYADESKIVVETNERPFVAHISGHDDAGTVYDAKDIKYLFVGDYATTEKSAEEGVVIKLEKYQAEQQYAVGTLLHNESISTADGYVRVKTAIAAADNKKWEDIQDKVESPWSDVTFEKGKLYMKLSGLYASSPDGPKTYTVYIADNAGNVANATASFILDTEPPTVDIKGIDFTKISKVHTFRMKSDLTPLTTYNDETHFVLEPSSLITAYKVCAYADIPTAVAGSHEDPSVPSTAGSTNMMSPDVYSSEADVSCMIKGADYQDAVKNTMRDFDAEESYEVGEFVTYDDKFYQAKKAHTGAWLADDFTEVPEVNGVHIVVAYVRDRAGSWSAAAVFEA